MGPIPRQWVLLLVAILVYAMILPASSTWSGSYKRNVTIFIEVEPAVGRPITMFEQSRAERRIIDVEARCAQSVFDILPEPHTIVQARRSISDPSLCVEGSVFYDDGECSHSESSHECHFNTHDSDWVYRYLDEDTLIQKRNWVDVSCSSVAASECSSVVEEKSVSWEGLYAVESSQLVTATVPCDESRCEARYNVTMTRLPTTPFIVSALANITQTAYDARNEVLFVMRGKWLVNVSDYKPGDTVGACEVADCKDAYFLRSNGIPTRNRS